MGKLDQLRDAARAAQAAGTLQAWYLTQPGYDALIDALYCLYLYVPRGATLECLFMESSDRASLTRTYRVLVGTAEGIHDVGGVLRELGLFHKSRRHEWAICGSCLTPMDIAQRLGWFLYQDYHALTGDRL